MSEISDAKLDRARDYTRKHYRKRVDHAAHEIQKTEKQKQFTAGFAKDREARGDFRDRRKKESQGKKTEENGLSDDDKRKINRHPGCNESFRYSGLRRRRWWERELPEWVPGVPYSGIASMGIEDKPSAFTIETVSTSIEAKAKSLHGKAKSLPYTKTRKQALSCGAIPTSPEENVRVAAFHLRSLPVAQRPSSSKACKAWLARCGCLNLCVDLLVPPGALAEALVPLLASDLSLQRSVMAFAKAGNRVTKEDPGPEPGHVSECAQRAHKRLQKVRQLFIDWPFSERALWLCAQSVGILRASPSTILDAMLEAGLATCDDKASLHWNVDKIASTPAFIKSAPWVVEDFAAVVKLGVCKTIHVPLPPGLKGQESVKMVREEGVAKVAARWRGFGFAAFGNNAPLIADLKVMFGWSDATKAREVILHAFVVAAEDSDASDFLGKLQGIVVDDLHSNFSPPQFHLDDLRFRKQFFMNSGRQLHALEMGLGCTLAIERGDRQELGSLTVTMRKYSSATENQTREILKLIFSKECAFACPTALTPSEAQRLNTWSHMFDAIGVTSLETNVCASLEFPQVLTGDLHILGHPNADALELGRGVYLAVQRFQKVASEAPRLIEEALPDIFARIKSVADADQNLFKMDQADMLLQAQYDKEAQDAVWNGCMNHGQKISLVSSGPHVHVR